MWEEFETIFRESPQELYLHWRAVAEDFWLDSFPQKRQNLQTSISNYFDERDIPTRSISRVQNYEEENYIVIESSDTLYYFDIYSEQFCGNSLSEANNFRNENPTPELQTILVWVPILEELMERNYAQWGFGEYLNNNDRVDFDAPEQFEWMTIREVQMTLRGNIRIFEENWGILWIDNARGREIATLYRSYMEIIMWIWDRYEQWSHFFHKTEGELDLYIRSSVYSLESFQDCTDYYIHIQRKIDDNTAQSKTNKQAYRIFSQKLWATIFERYRREFELWSENPEEITTLLEQWILLIELLRGREQNHSNIDSDMRNPLLAEEVCIYLLSRNGWILDTLENCTLYRLDFSDEVVWDRSPSQVIEETELKLRESWFENPSSFLQANFWVDRALLVWTWEQRYEDLSLEHKRQVSMLARLIQKFEQWEMSIEQIQNMDTQEAEQYIVWLWQEITREAFDAVREAYDRNFDSDSYAGRPIHIPPDFVGILESIWSDEADIGVLRLFNDIRGHDVVGWDGFLNYSDENLNMAWSLARSAGIIIGTIAVVMIATAVTGWVALPALASAWIWQALIASGWGLTLAGSLTSVWVGAGVWTFANLWFDPRSYDTFWEMAWDLSSDFVINTFHAIWMERLTMRLWEWFWILGRTGLIWGDISSGIGIEVLREYTVNDIFQSETLLGEFHGIWVDRALIWVSSLDIIQSVPEEVKQRFLQASHIYYLWHWENIRLYNEPEFDTINWYDSEEVNTALISWIERQEARI